MTAAKRKEREPSSGDPVLLVWEDADYQCDDESTVGEERPPEVTLMYTLGWYGRRSARHLTIWTDRYRAGEQWKLRGKLTVRRVDVVRVERIDLPD